MQRVQHTLNQIAPKLPIKYSKEVQLAKKNHAPIVALESTIISHGMKYPENLQCALDVETIIRQNGATPATIAILDGIIHIGLDHEDLEKLAKLGTSVRKVSRRDIALVVASKTHGATTVASTSYLAHLSGIPIFCTGGIGGVHRDYNDSLDVSADLRELGQTPITVICAGVKSILDIPRTLEYLETEGVTVASVGTKQFPAFFTSDSGIEAPYSVDTPLEAAKIIHANHQLQLSSGIIFAVPVPAANEASAGEINKAIQQALHEMATQGVVGKNITPFLLKRVAELTQGKSLSTNIALVKNNALFSAKLAVELNSLQHP